MLRSEVQLTAVHSSDEMYGADRMLLLVLEALGDFASPKVLLPNDVRATGASLFASLESLGIDVERVPLPILRRAYINPRGTITLIRNMWRLYCEFRRDKPDVLWCATSATLLAAPIAKLAGVSEIILHNQEIWGERESTVLGFLARAVTSVVAISEASRSSLPPRLQARSVVIPNATSAPAQITAPERDVTPTFLMASRWNSWKGHRTLLQAWAWAGEPGRLLVAGGPPPVGEATDVRAIISELSLSSSVELVGEQTDIGPLIERSHYILVPSDNPEPFGLVAIESLAHGRPVIASRGGGLGDIVVDGVSGFLFDNRDSTALAAILRNATVDRAIAMGRHSRGRYDDAYSEGAFVNAMRNYWGAERARV